MYFYLGGMTLVNKRLSLNKLSWPWPWRVVKLYDNSLLKNVASLLGHNCTCNFLNYKTLTSFNFIDWDSNDFIPSPLAGDRRSLSASPLQDVDVVMGLESLKDNAMNCNAGARPHSLDIRAVENKGTSNPFYMGHCVHWVYFFSGAMPQICVGDARNQRVKWWHWIWNGVP